MEKSGSIVGQYITNKTDDKMTKKSVKGIGRIKKMESLGDFDVDKIADAIDANKDIIRRVEPGESGEYSISIYLNLRATKDKLVCGVADLFKRFDACSVDLDYDKGVRILKFWWDESARNF